MRAGQILGIPLLLVLAALGGCGTQCHLPDCPSLPFPDAGPACDGRPPEAVAADHGAFTAVSTVVNPEAAERQISLHECLALALEKGRVGGTSIRVLAYEPAMTYTAIEAALGNFDARWFTSVGWSAIDERAGNVLSTIPLGFAPTATPSATGTGVVSSVGAAGAGAIANLVGLNNVSGGSFESSLSKPLPTGGVAGITFKTDYTLVNQPPPQPGELNPTYRPRLIFNAEQPLLRGAGVAVNQVPILIARLSFDQEREKFFGAVNQLLFAVEQAYWDLYFSYWNLHTQDVALRQAHDAWQIAKLLQEKKLVSVQDLANIELQYQTLRLARLDALGGPGVSVLEAERRLRFVVGLPPEDGCRLVPADTPTTAPYVPDWQSAVAAALDNRPELVQLRQELKKIQLDLKRMKNQTLPDLRAVGSYDINGLGNRLDGAGPDNAFRSLASNHFNDWTAGLTLDIPIGFRIANSQLRRGQLLLTQRTIQLRDMEKQATFALQQSYRELLRAYEAVQIQGSIRKAATERYQSLYELFRTGLEGPNFLLLAQQDWTRALAAERASIFAYNTAIAKFELEKGTIQEFDHVTISDGPLPACVLARASAHIGERQRALLLRERPAPAASGCACGPGVAEAPPTLTSLRLEEILAPEPQPGRAAGGEPLPAPRSLPAVNSGS